ncbi:McrC family protein [Hyalangium rubrum]|uniref:Restriction endonuclease n=1 Tax=Hyalangium rubrum TaxID=3103134 RepID=A0ABU5H9X3_9BACT|nr:restriction endonuclease [Hyalangium sp. s54d21]MDY7230273.1 restriction endonuclease [Hyalangium sp. s54d21]
MTVWTLTEWEWAELPLSPADVLAAQGHLGSALAVEPSARGVRLRALGVAGMVALPGGVLHVRPKVPALHLLALLDYAAREVPWTEEVVGAAEADELLPLLGELFVRRVERLARGGWVHGYREQESLRPALRGRWLVGRDLARPPTHRHRLSCQFDEFTRDVAPNRVLLAALRELERSSAFGPQVTARARMLASTLEEVEPVADTRAAVRTLASDRRFAPYGPALGLARLILEGHGAQATPGPHPLASFILRLAPLFEAAVTRALAKVALARGLPCHAQRPLSLDTQGQLTVIPDVVLERGEARLVIDAKYKLPASGLPLADDFQQLVTYLACADAYRGALVLPALGAVPEETSLRLSPFGRRCEVRVVKVPLGGRAATVGLALESCAERLISWLPGLAPAARVTA